LMSISDKLMWRYFELLSFRSLKEIEAFKLAVNEGKNPRDIKFELALEIVARFHNEDLAEKAKHEFISRFQKGAVPSEMPEHSLEVLDGEMGVAHILKYAGLVTSTSEAFRMIKQGAVKIDGERVDSKDITISAGTTHIYQVGKRRFAKIELK